MNRAALRLIAVFLLIIGLACPASAQTTKTAWEKQIGTDCNNGSASADFDTLAQCSATSGAGTFQKAPLFVGQVTSPPYATTACDSAKKGMIQWTGTAFQGCNGTSWQTIGEGSGSSGTFMGYSFTTGSCSSSWNCQPTCPAGQYVVSGGCFTANNAVALAYSAPSGPTSWFCGSQNYTATTWQWALLCTSGNASNSYLGPTATAANPSRNDDLTTGLFSATASTVSIATSGTERLRVTATGSVGIGTTSPNQLLEVFSSISDKGRIRISGTGTTADRYDGLEIFGKAGSATSFAGGLFREESTDRIAIWNSTGSILNISQSGNVGIVTTTPSERLDLGGGNISMGYENKNQILLASSVSSNVWTAQVQICPTGKYITGGGCWNNVPNVMLPVSYSAGTIAAYNSGTTGNIYCSVTCANIR